jgi:hypothetical protein
VQTEARVFHHLSLAHQLFTQAVVVAEHWVVQRVVEDQGAAALVRSQVVRGNQALQIRAAAEVLAVVQVRLQQAGLVDLEL